MIKMNNIIKSYPVGNERLNILKNISFEVKKGEFTAILGPSGSGKSTLMNIIGCMDLWDSGEYFLDGEAIHNMSEKQMTGIRNEKIGFIFQRYQLINTYNVQENVIMPLLIRGYSKKEAIAKTERIIDLLGLSERLKHKPSELSGGQQQRVAIARALAGEPMILLADEPTGALDTNTGKEVLNIFGELNELGNTIVMITHDLNVAKSAQRIVNIVDGELS